MNCQSVMVPVADVKVNGEIRGTDEDMRLLMASLREVGQLHDIVLNSDYLIIFGRGRLAAAKRLGWKEIRAQVNPSMDDAILALKAERDENVCRIPLSRDQMFNLAARLEAMERPAARERQAAGGGIPGSGKLPEPAPQVRDKVAEAVGISGRTLAKGQAIIHAAEEHPDRYLDLAKLVNTDREPIDPLHKEFKKRKEVYDAADTNPGRFGELARRLADEGTEVVYDEFKRKSTRQKPKVVKDKAGNEIPKGLQGVFSETWRQDAAKGLEAVKAEFAKVIALIRKNTARKEDSWFDWADFSEECVGVEIKIYDLIVCIRESIPLAVCGECDGSGCDFCKQSGYTTARSPRTKASGTTPGAGRKR